jgi:hypothetical protein
VASEASELFLEPREAWYSDVTWLSARGLPTREAGAAVKSNHALLLGSRLGCLTRLVVGTLRALPMQGAARREQTHTGSRGIIGNSSQATSV